MNRPSGDGAALLYTAGAPIARVVPFSDTIAS